MEIDVTGRELKAIRTGFGLSAAAMGRALAYAGPNANVAAHIRRLERGSRDIPPAIARLAQMFRDNGIPDEWLWWARWSSPRLVTGPSIALRALGSGGPVVAPCRKARFIWPRRDGCFGWCLSAYLKNVCKSCAYARMIAFRWSSVAQLDARADAYQQTKSYRALLARRGVLQGG